MAFTKKAFKWLKRGTVPPETLQENGFTAGTKLPADYLNEQFTATYEAIEELQANAVEKVNGKGLSTNDYTNAEKYKDVYVTCTTAASTTAKVATLSGFTLTTGAMVKAKFSYANTATAPTLNVNSTGAKAIKNVDGTAFTDIKASTYTFVYDGTNYVVQNAIIVEDSTTSTSTTNAASAKAVKTAYDLATEAKQSASDGKVKIATAIAGKGQTASSSDTFQQLATAIDNIEVGVDTSDATATASDILSSKTAYVNGNKVNGSMPNNGAISQSLAINGTYTIPAGYHNGSGKVMQSITTKSAQTYTPSTADQTIASGRYLTGTQTIKGDADLVAENIKSGVDIFGVTGTLDVASLGGKRWASGTALSTSTTTLFTLYNSGVKEESFYTVSVSNLPFNPSIIVISNQEVNSTSTIYKKNGLFSAIGGTIIKALTSNAKHITDGGGLIVSDGVFTLPVVQYNKVFDWIAFE